MYPYPVLGPSIAVIRVRGMSAVRRLPACVTDLDLLITAYLKVIRVVV
jgi:hypothetical protein